MDISVMVDEAGRIAQEHGWEDEPRSFGDIVALIHSEASEALEAYREGHAVTYTFYRERDGKPEGVPSELADIVIRVAHFCHVEGIDLDEIIQEKMRFNDSRPYRHGGKAL